MLAIFHAATETKSYLPTSIPFPCNPHFFLSLSLVFRLNRRFVLHRVITVATFPLEKTIQVVRPDVVRWYQCHFMYTPYGKPKEEVLDLGLSDQTEPMDLSFRSNASTVMDDENAVAVASIQMEENYVLLLP